MSRGELRAEEACLYNNDVHCRWRMFCPACGWNPEVAARRAAAIRAKLNGENTKTRKEAADACKHHAHDGR